MDRAVIRPKIFRLYWPVWSVSWPFTRLILRRFAVVSIRISSPSLGSHASSRRVGANVVEVESGNTGLSTVARRSWEGGLSNGSVAGVDTDRGLYDKLELDELVD